MAKAAKPAGKPAQRARSTLKFSAPRTPTTRLEKSGAHRPVRAARVEVSFGWLPHRAERAPPVGPKYPRLFPPDVGTGVGTDIGTGVLTRRPLRKPQERRDGLRQGLGRNCTSDVAVHPVGAA